MSDWQKTKQTYFADISLLNPISKASAMSPVPSCWNGEVEFKLYLFNFQTLAFEENVPTSHLYVKAHFEKINKIVAYRRKISIKYFFRFSSRDINVISQFKTLIFFKKSNLTVSLQFFSASDDANVSQELII
jgi:hypothetical protein